MKYVLQINGFSGPRPRPGLVQQSGRAIIMDSQTPASSKEVLLVALGWFISRFTNCLKLFFATLKGAQQADWNQECDQALIAIKQYLTEPPVFAIPEAGDILYLYLAVSEIEVSAALFKED